MINSIKARLGSVAKEARAIIKITIPLSILQQWTSVYIADVNYCVGDSMLPNYFTGDVMVVSKLIKVPNQRQSGILQRILPEFLYHEVQRGDVLCCEHPYNRNMLVSKRLIGLPHDRIISRPLDADSQSIQVPPNHCWVAGDNYSHSQDSRHYGCIPLRNIKGVVMFKVWPSFERVKNGFYDMKSEIE
ncbi:hypothetical protein MIR68_007872 [Amoeboaphelidium protococcarum]|nr:hypothetical protein MIR68_007872 [Amoeboaphelidium protococcarum]